MRTALVTGGARRIGASIVEGLAADGYAVAIHYNGSAGEAEALARKITERGGSAVPLQADLTSHEAVQALLPKAREALGPIGLLVNNASLFEHDEIDTVTGESWEAHLGTNLKAPAFLSQALAAQLPDGSSGNIINIIDQRVWRPTPKFFSYTIAKIGLWGMTQTLAQALAPAVRVNGIGPGPTLANSRQDQDAFDRQIQALPLQHGTGLAEIQTAVRFILETPSLTGQMLALDGGQHLAWRTPDVEAPE